MIVKQHKNPFRILSWKNRTANLQNHSQYQHENEPMVEITNEVCPPRRLTEILIKTARDLQVLPDVATKAISIAENPDAKVKNLVSVVAQDVKLTSDILSFSNSSVFGLTQPIVNLQHAITRVGFRQTKNMILASSITSMMQTMDWQEVRVRDLLCRHSLLTGVINSQLNTLFEMGMQGEEFTAGLVHDIGRTLLAVSIPAEFATFDALDFVEPENHLLRELDAIGTSHAEVGAWFLQRNHLPEELVTVARFHHQPLEANRFTRLVALTALADDLANFSQRNDPTEAFVGSENSHLQFLEELGVRGATHRLHTEVDSVLDSARLEMTQMLR